MDEKKTWFFPRYGNLLWNLTITLAFFGMGAVLQNFFVGPGIASEPDAYMIFLLCVCLAVPIAINAATLPQYRRIGMDGEFLYVNDTAYRWSCVAIEGTRTLTKKLRAAYVITVAERTEELLMVRLFETPDAATHSRKIRISSGIYPDYSSIAAGISARARSLEPER